jgi:molybdopterin-synthase adenylyltransferase
LSGPGDIGDYYSRQIVLPEIGTTGQRALAQSKVLVVGAGGLGSPLLMYLAGAGVGVLGVVDFDVVERSNLHRQILHGVDRIDSLKTASAVQTLANINPHIQLIRHDEPIGPSNAERLIAPYDVVADGSDNFDTRDAVHSACRNAGITLVSGAIQLTSGILTTFKSHEAGNNPCFRCLYPDRPNADVTPSCSAIGVLGPAVGAMGSLQAIEVIKEILGIGPSLSGTLVMYDAFACEIEKIDFPQRADCAVCGAKVQPPVTGGNNPTVSAG